MTLTETRVILSLIMIRIKTDLSKIFLGNLFSIRWLFFFALCLSQFQCATVRLDRDYTGPVIRPPELDERYRQPTGCPVLSQEKNPDGFIRVTIQVQNGDEPLTIDYYPCDENGSAPGLLISPILGGKNRVASHFAQRFSMRGYHCLVVHRPPDLLKKARRGEAIELSSLEEQMCDAVIRDRIALDWLCQQEGVDTEALGSFGVSYGGIKNVILAGVEPRLKANVFALAGGDFGSILTTSNLEKLDSIRTAIREKNGWTMEELRDAIREEILSEPLRFAPYINAQKTFLILARMDATVPRRTGERLRQALGCPKTLYVPTGHYSAVLLTGMVVCPYIEQRALTFFDEHLKS